MTENLAEVQPGDTLFRVNRYGSEEVKVSRVGYKYLYLIEYGRESPTKYDLLTGAEVTNGCGYGSSLYTLEGWSMEQRRTEARNLLMDAGLTLNGHLARNLTAQQLETILAVVAPEA